MKKLLRTQRLGVTLVELMIVLAITAALVPVAFSAFSNRDRIALDSSTQTMQNALRLIHNNAESGLGPLPDSSCPGGASCPIRDNELIFGQAVVFGHSPSTFSGVTFADNSSASPVLATNYAAIPLKLGDKLNPPDDFPRAVRSYQYSSTSSFDKHLPDDYGYNCWVAKKKTGPFNPSCHSDSMIGIVFFKVNFHQTVLPVQTRIFTSDLADFSGGSCSPSTKSNCYSSTNEYNNDSYDKVMLQFASLSDRSRLQACIIIEPDANDIQYKSGSDCHL